MQGKWDLGLKWHKPTKLSGLKISRNVVKLQWGGWVVRALLG